MASALSTLRVLICCPRGRDASLIEAALNPVAIETQICNSVGQLKEEAERDAGAIILAFEALSQGGMNTIRDLLDKQERWSDVPVIVLCSPFHTSGDMRQHWLLEMLPSATIVSRPVQRDVLVRTVQVALRMRVRQYELRSHLEEKDALVRSLEDASRAKDEFLGLISHELRTPATSISGSAKVLRRRGDRLGEETRSELLLAIDEEADRLCSMIENLLLLSRADGSDMREPMLIRHKIDEVVERFTAASNRKTRVEVAPGLPPVVCNADLFEHVLFNLLSNADKYSPREEEIEVTAIAKEDSVVTAVSDRGPGVKPDELDLIFERFYRNPDLALTARGLGLGLTVCRRLVESQGGQIWASLREGGGLEINVKLPTLDDAEAYDSLINEDIEAAVNTASI